MTVKMKHNLSELLLIPWWHIGLCEKCERICQLPFLCVFDITKLPINVLMEDDLDDISLEEASIETDHTQIITFE